MHPYPHPCPYPYKIYCHDLEVMGLNLAQVEIGLLSISMKVVLEPRKQGRKETMQLRLWKRNKVIPVLGYIYLYHSPFVPRRPYFPHSLALSCNYPISKC